MRLNAHISCWACVSTTGCWEAGSAVSRAIGSTPSSSSDSDSLELPESCAGLVLGATAVLTGAGAGREGSALAPAFFSCFFSSSSLLSASLESLPLLLLSLALLALVALALADAAVLGVDLDAGLVVFFELESDSDSDSESDPEPEVELPLEGDFGFLLAGAAAAALGVELDFFASAGAGFLLKALLRKAFNFSSLSLPLSLEASSEELVSESSDRSLLLVMAGIWGFDVDFLALASLTDLAIALRELTELLGAMMGELW